MLRHAHVGMLKIIKCSHYLQRIPQQSSAPAAYILYWCRVDRPNSFLWCGSFRAQFTSSAKSFVTENGPGPSNQQRKIHRQYLHIHLSRVAALLQVHCWLGGHFCAPVNQARKHLSFEISVCL
eukprot:jgi/Ulvmu1/76/UM001_0079.1